MLEIYGDIPEDITIPTGSTISVKSRSQTDVTHALHKYPAKFYPELPRYLIKRYSTAGDTVLDPFCGSGTTNVEALLAGRHSIGIDIDPLARLLARVKTTPLEEGALWNAYDKMRATIVVLLWQYPDDERIRPPDFPNQLKWFDEDALMELACIQRAVNSHECEPAVREFLTVCFSAVILRSSHADNSCAKTCVLRKRAKPYEQGYATRIFHEQLRKNIIRVLAFSERVTAVETTIPLNMSATDIRLPDASVDIGVTSPPYVNAMDYPRAHQLELYWLGYSHDGVIGLKRRNIGTEMVTAEQYRELSRMEDPEVDAMLQTLYDTDKRKCCIAHTYLRSMEEHLQAMQRVLKPDSVYAMVIGANTIAGHTFETPTYMERLALRNGFAVESYFDAAILNHYNKGNADQRMHSERVLVLRKERK